MKSLVFQNAECRRLHSGCNLDFLFFIRSLCGIPECTAIPSPYGRGRDPPWGESLPTLQSGCGPQWRWSMNTTLLTLDLGTHTGCRLFQAPLAGRRRNWWMPGCCMRSWRSGGTSPTGSKGALMSTGSSRARTSYSPNPANIRPIRGVSPGAADSPGSTTSSPSTWPRSSPWSSARPVVARSGATSSPASAGCASCSKRCPRHWPPCAPPQPLAGAATQAGRPSLASDAGAGLLTAIQRQPAILRAPRTG